MDEKYRAQVSLLLSALPEVAKEECFALHGGTAINLFVRDMPRLSVDIDLTYLHIEDRNTSLQNINEALDRIKVRIEKILPNCKVTHADEIFKLLVSHKGVGIKIEVSSVSRGAFGAPQPLELHPKVQEAFDVYCQIKVVSLGQLYGGKICAALDRQHPRDLFDIKYLFDNGGITDEIRIGFILALLGSVRPTHEILKPRLLDQTKAFGNQFAGMTTEAYTYEEYEEVRLRLVQTITESLQLRDKKFILGVIDATPDWTIHDFQQFPSIQWKLMNLQKLKDNDPQKHQDNLEQLRALLNE